jgi:hypothetical protein
LAAGAALAPAPALLALALSAFIFLARSFTSRMALSRLAWRNCGDRQAQGHSGGRRGRQGGGGAHAAGANHSAHQHAQACAAEQVAVWQAVTTCMVAALRQSAPIKRHNAWSSLDAQQHSIATNRLCAMCPALSHLGLLCPPLVDDLQADTHDGAGSRLVGHTTLLASNLGHLVLLVGLPASSQGGRQGTGAEQSELAC